MDGLTLLSLIMAHALQQASSSKPCKRREYTILPVPPTNTNLMDLQTSMSSLHLLTKTNKTGYNPHLILMHYHNTSLGFNLQSPIKILMAIRVDLPVLHTVRMNVGQAQNSHPQAEIACPTKKNQEEKTTTNSLLASMTVPDTTKKSCVKP